MLILKADQTCKLHVTTVSITKKLINTYVIRLLGMFDRDIAFSPSLMTLILNLAFLSGRSKQGNARLASMGENCVLASHLQSNETKRTYI